VLTASVLILLGLGTVMVFNTSYFYAQDRFGDAYLFTRKHLIALVTGGAALGVAWRMPSRWLRPLTYPLLAVAAAALATVLHPGIGVANGGARRWFDLGGFNFQPSELAKLAVVLYLAHSITKKGERVRRFATGFLPHVVVCGAIAGLVVLEPDYGTAVLVGVILFVMLMSGGARLTHLAGAAALALPVVIWGATSADYRWARLTSFLHPWQDARRSGFQLVQSLVAFGSGGLSGVGLGAGRQKMFYLPGAHTDFIFSVIGEELGLVGTLGVVALFGLVAFGGYRLAWRRADPYAAQLAFGLTSLLVLQAAVNMAVTVGLLPTKGIPLPFVSYGGSALVFSMLEMGCLLSIARESRLESVSGARPSSDRVEVSGIGAVGWTADERSGPWGR
jgi:cell division protein FtsW